MTTEQQAPDLNGLDDRYEIRGELRGSEGARTYLGKRREDGTEVRITVVRSPSADAGANNALAHFASDMQLLSTISHPKLARAIEGKWLAKDAFAAISEHMHGVNLGEMMSRGDRLPPPRIATVLADVNAVIEWARDNGIVHRGVTSNDVVFEEGTNRVSLSFSMTPIPLANVPGPAEDAKTIGSLAWVMLTGEVLPTDATAESLAEHRPDLATRVVNDTVAIAGSRTNRDAPDIAAFIAVVATAETLKAAEVELARLRAEIMEESRVALAKSVEEQNACAARAKEIEERLANERVEFERRMTEERTALAAEQGQHGAECAQLEAERIELRQSVADLESRRQQLEKRQAEVESRCAEVDGRHAEVEQLRTDVTRLQAEVDGAWAVVSAAPAETASSSGIEKKPTTTPPASRGLIARHWVKATAATVTAGLIIALIVGIHRASSSSAAAADGALLAPSPSPITGRNLPRGGFLTQSAAGPIAPRSGPPFAQPGQAQSPPPADSATNDSTAAKPVAAVQRKSVNPAAVRRPSADSAPAPKPVDAGDSTSRRDSMARRDSIAKPDSTTKRDSTRSDTTVKRGTPVKRDSTRRDTTVKRDTTAKRDTLVRPRPDTLSTNRDHTN